MAVKPAPGDRGQRFLSALFAMRTAVLLMIMIICVSLVATVYFPQDDVFHTRWFQALLALLCVNMAVCTVRQLRHMIGLTKSLPPIIPAGNWQQRQWNSTLQASDITEYLRTRNYRFHMHDTVQATIIYADKGLIGRWGTVAVHIAILIIAVGALTGNLLGFTNTIQVGKNETIAVPLTKNGSQQAQLTLNDFRIEYYPDGNISEFISDLTIATAGDKREQTIKINHPLQFQDIAVYQMDHGNQVLAQLQRNDGTSVTTTWLADDRQLVIDQEQGIVLQVIQYVPDFNPHRPAVTLSPLPNNPKVLYAFYQQEKAVHWGVADFGQILRIQGYDATVTFTDVRPYSLLDVKSDPGVPIVMTGFLLLSLAFFCSVLIRYHQLQIKIPPFVAGCKIHSSVSRLSLGAAEQLLAEIENCLAKGEG